MIRSRAIADAHRQVLRVLVVVVAVIGASSFESAYASFIAQFPSPSSTASDSGGNGIGFGDYCCFFQSGHSVTQTFTGTGLSSVDELALSIPVAVNSLTTGNEVDFNVLLNGIVVGSLDRTAAQGAGTAVFDSSFPPIADAGGNYTVELLETNNVPGNGGSIGLNFGTLTLTPSSVPEPSSLALLVVSLLGLGFLRWSVRH